MLRTCVLWVNLKGTVEDIKRSILSGNRAICFSEMRTDKPSLSGFLRIDAANGYIDKANNKGDSEQSSQVLG